MVKNVDLKRCHIQSLPLPSPTGPSPACCPLFDPADDAVPQHIRARRARLASGASGTEREAGMARNSRDGRTEHMILLDKVDVVAVRPIPEAAVQSMSFAYN